MPQKIISYYTKNAKIDAYRVDGEIVGAAQGLIGIKTEGAIHVVDGSNQSFLKQLISTSFDLSKPLEWQVMDRIRQLNKSIEKHKRITPDENQ